MRAAVVGAIALSMVYLALTGCANGSGASGNPSPAAGSRASKDANARADLASNAGGTYAHADKKGPRLIVLPGEIKSTSADFPMTTNSIADFGELELSRANFTVLERNDLGPMLKEVELAFDMGDPKQAGRLFQKGKLQSTRWIVRFDVLKAESIADSSGGFEGSAASALIGLFSSSTAAQAGSITADSVKTEKSAKVWLVGLRYKILDANTTEQVATGYFEGKMEGGSSAHSVLGFSVGGSGQVSLDTLVQRLVQKSVTEIDAKYK